MTRHIHRCSACLLAFYNVLGCHPCAALYTNAAPLSADVAQRKARTAAVTRRPTKFWEDRAKERPGFLKFSADLMIQGGLPLLYRGECVGGIGVSGVQSAEDEQIATAVAICSSSAD